MNEKQLIRLLSVVWIILMFAIVGYVIAIEKVDIKILIYIISGICGIVVFILTFGGQKNE